MIPKNYYEWLCVAPEATDEEIKRAFKKLAQEHHPDKGGDPAKFREVKEAYEILGDKTKRKVYDETGTVAQSEDISKIRALEQIASMLITIMDADEFDIDHTDILEYLKERIRNTVTATNLEMIRLQNRIAKRRRMLARLSKSETNNSEITLNLIIANETAKATENINRFRLAMEELELMLEIIAEYGYAVVQQPTSPTIVTYQQIINSTTNFFTGTV